MKSLNKHAVFCFSFFQGERRYQKIKGTLSSQVFSKCDQSIRDYFHPYTPEKPTLLVERQGTDQAQILPSIWSSAMST